MSAKRATARGQPLEIVDFSGGEASVFPVTKMPPRYSLLLQNAYITERGGVGKIPGYTKVNTASCGVSLKSGYEFVLSNGTTQKLVAGGGKIFRVAGDVLTEIYTGLDTDATVRFSTIKDLCIMTNGVNAHLKYDGTTVSVLGGSWPSTVFKTHVHKARLWAIERANRMMATHSVLNNPEDCTTSGDAGYIDFRYVLPTGDELLDIKTEIDLLVFFFRRHIAIYSGSTPSGTNSDFALVQIIDIGTVATDAIQALGSDLTFLYDTGIKSLKQVVTTGKMTVPDKSYLIDPTIAAKVKDNRAGTFASAHYPRRGWFLLLTGNVVWIYDYARKSWSRMTGADVAGMFTTQDGQLYLCGNGFLYLYDDVWSFTGQGYEWKWEQAWLSLTRGGNDVYPAIMKLSTPAEVPAAIRLEVQYDLKPVSADCIQTFAIEQNVTLIDDVLDWDALSPIDESSLANTIVPMFGGGRIMKCTFSNTSTVGPIEFNTMALLAEPGGF